MIFPVSARLALAGRTSESGIPELKNYLQHYLSDERGRVLPDNASSDGQRLCAYLRQNLGIKARSLGLTLEEPGDADCPGAKRAVREATDDALLQARIVFMLSRTPSRLGFGSTWKSLSQPFTPRCRVKLIALAPTTFASTCSSFAGHVQAVGRAGRRPRGRGVGAAGRADHPDHERKRPAGDGDAGGGNGPADTRVDLQVDTSNTTSESLHSGR